MIIKILYQNNLIPRFVVARLVLGVLLTVIIIRECWKHGPCNFRNLFLWLSTLLVPLELFPMDFQGFCHRFCHRFCLDFLGFFVLFCLRSRLLLLLIMLYFMMYLFLVSVIRLIVFFLLLLVLFLLLFFLWLMLFLLCFVSFFKQILTLPLK